MKTLEDFRNLLSTPQKIVICSHRNPDGDAIGSSIGFANFLKKLNHQVSIIVPSQYPQNLLFLPGIEDVIIYDKTPDITEKVIQSASVAAFLDFNALDRIDKVGELISERGDNIVTVMIDHHLDPEPCANIMICDSTASSTCEMIYRTIVDLGYQNKVDLAIAEALMTGIFTDTGGFSYAISPRLFRIVAELFEHGVDNEKLRDQIFNSMNEKQLRLLGHCLVNRLNVYPEEEAGLITLSKKDYDQFKIVRGDTEGIVNYILRLKGIKIAAFITEQPSITKVSLRSKGDVNVKEIAQSVFNGGGHKNAAGGYNYGSLRQTKTKFLDALKERTKHTI